MSIHRTTTAKPTDVACSAGLKGILAEGAGIEVNLDGYHGSWFLAKKVEVEIEEAATED